MPSTYPTLGGAHSDTTVIARALAARGLQNPLTKQPFSEAMILGIGGGIGGMYFVWEMCGMVWLTVGGRYWIQDNVKFYDSLGRQLGLSMNYQQPGGKKAAQTALDGMLAQGPSALAWVDLASLPYHGVDPRWKKGLVHTLGVIGQNKDGSYLVDDRAPMPFTISREALEEARQTQPYMKARLLDFALPKKAIDVAAAVAGGINTMIEYSLNPPIKNFGIPAFEKWADLVVNKKDKKGWPTVMATDTALGGALLGAYQSIETDTGGGLLRPLYAEFLTEAGKQTKNKGLIAAAKESEALGKQWTDFAHACLPDSLKWTRESKKILVAREAARMQGPKGEKEVAKANAALDVKREEVNQGFPATFRDTLYADLHARLVKICEGERNLVASLGDAI